MFPTYTSVVLQLETQLDTEELIVLKQLTVISLIGLFSALSYASDAAAQPPKAHKNKWHRRRSVPELSISTVGSAGVLAVGSILLVAGLRRRKAKQG